MKPRLQAEKLTGMTSLLRDKFLDQKKFETLLFCANEKKFSFWWIEKQFVQVHPGENVSESGGVSRDRAEFIGVKETVSLKHAPNARKRPQGVNRRPQASARLKQTPAKEASPARNKPTNKNSYGSKYCCCFVFNNYYKKIHLRIWLQLICNIYLQDWLNIHEGRLYMFIMVDYNSHNGAFIGQLLIHNLTSLSWFYRQDSLVNLV